MKSVSNEFRKKIVSNREFLYKANITFSDGSKLELSDKNDLMSNGISITSATSGTDSFDIGAAVMGELVLTLNNSTGKFDKYNFLDAEINLKIGLQLEDSVEYLQMGIYTVDEAQTADITIVLSALDRLSWFEKAYSNVKTAYPATLYQIVSDVCKYCVVSFTMGKFDYGDMVIQKRPDDSELSCLEVISYAAQISGCYAVADEWGRMFFKWYDTGVFENALHLDGGKFRDFTSGDLADGGDFTDYSSDGQLDGGTFADQREFAHIYSMSSMTVGTDEIVVTGIRVAGNSEDATEEEDEGQGTEEENTGYLYGEEGYVLAISENPFITVEMENEIAAYLGRKIIGMKIRTFSVSAVSNPSIEAGDCAYISDRKGNSYPVYITNVTFKLCDYEDFSCGAESPGRNRASGSSAATKAIIAARKEIKRQITTYDMAVQQLTNLIANSFGVFKTEEAQEDGSVIYYLHNKPELSASSTIWKMTSDAFAVSTDGGKTWNAGIDSSGNAVVNILNAIGINADWINTGSLRSVTIDNGDGAFTVDADGNVKIQKGSIDIGNGNFTVDATGKMKAKNVEVSGKVSTSEITGSSINNGDGTFRVDKDGNLTANSAEISGKIIGKDGYSLEYTDTSTRPVITKQYVFAETGYDNPSAGGLAGDAFLNIKSPGGTTVMSVGNILYSQEPLKFYAKDAPVFPKGALIEHAYIDSLQQTYTDNITVSNGDEYIVFNVRNSGAFVTVYGSYYVYAQKAGVSKEIVIGQKGDLFIPTYAAVKTVGFSGKRTFVFGISTDGKFSARNASELDLDTAEEAASIKFRFDFFRM